MAAIIAFIIIFGILVVVHEFGHFYMAKRSGILVREFSIGMGPKLFATRKNGTTYTIRWLPLGGYVRMAGMADDESEIEAGTQATLLLDEQETVQKINTSDKVTTLNGVPFQIAKTDLQKELWIEGYESGDESELKRYSVSHDATIVESDGTEVQIAPVDVQFQSASLINRMLTNFAGPFNNFILAIVAFALFAFLNGGVPQNKVIVGTVMPNSPAQKAGLKMDDRLVKVAGKKVTTFTDFSSVIAKYPNKPVNVQVKRAKQTKSLEITPKAVKVEGQKGKVGQIGVTAGLNHSVGAKLKYGFTQSWANATQIFKILGSFLTGGFSLNKLAGPVGMYSMTTQFASQGFTMLVYFLAFLSVNLGIMNLIPIPALDGGKLVINVIEAIRGKPISPEKEGIVTLVGVGIMVVLMVLVTWNDIQRFFF
ncbi:RIP metalloprotease RseP [Latilactobacillus curvatus]|uniref:RIP metalloprotease RseP n=1 Tax=Latilactobacillus curvatus TaxID=28038 RepID=UPI0010AE75CA|nr:RIP metalloprotease RseP [Latilactobacillus curvatus]MCS6143350.1 RIP metalloprotease RseP [Latilactobacillus curvatus]QWF36294.1 RIP metalloprotease RseP [Latilactobacillus curvatus]TJY24522.1 RIP metalloprotease RseP [Latilactobacillus curvatus]